MCGVHARAVKSYDLSEIGTIEGNHPVLHWHDPIRIEDFLVQYFT